MVIKPNNEQSIDPVKKKQKGFLNCSIIVFPEIFLHNNLTKKEEMMEDFMEMFGPYVYGKIIQAPNRKLTRTQYTIFHYKNRPLVDGVTYDELTELLPGIELVKKLLKTVKTIQLSK